MPPRLSKTDLPRDPSPLLRGFRACRDVMIETSSSVRVGGPVYHAAAMVVAAIDAMAVLLSTRNYCASADDHTDRREAIRMQALAEGLLWLVSDMARH
jgi:hypothetical protein